MEMILADGLHNDCTNTAVYALYIQIFMAQKRFGEAQRMAKTSLRFVGQQNHQILFLFAQSLADDPAGGGQSGTEQAVLTLEKMVQDGHFLSLELLLLLSRLYDRQHKYDKAIMLLNRFKEVSYGDPRIHRELGDLLSKTNRPKEALGEYGQAMNANTPDTVAKERVWMIALMGGFTTPQSVANAAFKNGGSTSNIATTNVANTSRSSSERVIRVPPPVTRVTRRTAVNQHEQLRRLRGMGTYSATGSPESSMGGSRAQFRRMAAVRGLHSGRSIIGDPLSSDLLSRPLQFQDDISNEDDSSRESSNDSQLSLVADSLEQSPNNSSSVLEQARGSNNSTVDWNRSDRNSIFRHMTHLNDIQRYFTANESLATTGEGTANSILTTNVSTTAASSVGTTTLRGVDATTETITTVTSLAGSSLRSIDG
uniref:TPR_REGION domain-containing protein n=1 Tax=Meloidogyne hapla TaxID=6305 RepID=A0A1I8B7A9_MELHA